MEFDAEHNASPPREPAESWLEEVWAPVLCGARDLLAVPCAHAPQERWLSAAAGGAAIAVRFPRRTPRAVRKAWRAAVAARGLRCERFVVLRTAEGGFALLPADSAGAFRAGMHLLPTPTIGRRRAAEALEAAASVGLVRWLGLAETWLISPEDFRPREGRIVLVAGPPGLERILDAHVIDEHEAASGRTRIACGPAGAARLAGEARALRATEPLDLRTARIPRVIAVDPDGRWLVTTPLLGEPAPRGLLPPHEDFLAELDARTGSSSPLCELRSFRAACDRITWLERVARSEDTRRLGLLRDLAQERLRDTVVRAGFAHGRLSPESTLLCPDGVLGVVDWADARSDAVRGHDAMAFVTSVEALSRRPDAVGLHARLHSLGAGGRAGLAPFLLDFGSREAERRWRRAGSTSAAAASRASMGALLAALSDLEREWLTNRPSRSGIDGGVRGSVPGSFPSPRRRAA